MKKLCNLFVALILLLLLGAVGPLFAEEEPDLGWSDTAEVGLVYTDGNSESSAFSIKNTLVHDWERAKLTIRAMGTRVKTTTVLERFAVGTTDDFTVTTIDVDETTVENYLFDGRYNHKISDDFFWYTGAGWYKNEPSGIDSRSTIEGGVGNIWWDNDDLKFSTTYGVTYTDQKDVVEVPGVDGTYAGARFAWNYENKIGSNAVYQNLLVLDASFDESDDWRGDMTNALSVTIGPKLALKVGLQWLYENQPAFREVPIVGGPDDGETVFVELDDLDTIFTTSLVVNF